MGESFPKDNRHLLPMSTDTMKPIIKNSLSYTVIILLFSAVPSLSGEADVIDVKVSSSKAGSYTFDVTVSHKDTGWDHYADKWEILDDKEEIVGTRILHHPHVDEQPFTRSLSGVEIPPSIKEVTVRAHDSVHEYGGKVFNVKLP